MSDFKYWFGLVWFTFVFFCMANKAILDECKDASNVGDTLSSGWELYQCQVLPPRLGNTTPRYRWVHLYQILTEVK